MIAAARPEERSGGPATVGRPRSHQVDSEPSWRDFVPVTVSQCSDQSRSELSNLTREGHKETAILNPKSANAAPPSDPL
eukprot:214861-Hanusia_phi.AAC.1